MNYDIYIHNKIQVSFSVFGLFSNCFDLVSMVVSFFNVCWVFGVLNCYFEYVYRILCIFLYIWSDFEDMFKYFHKNVPEVWTSVVRTFVWDVLDFGVLNCPTSCSIRRLGLRWSIPRTCRCQRVGWHRNVAVSLDVGQMMYSIFLAKCWFIFVRIYIYIYIYTKPYI